MSNAYLFKYFNCANFVRCCSSSSETKLSKGLNKLYYSILYYSRSLNLYYVNEPNNDATSISVFYMRHITIKASNLDPIYE
jgi:hypothetical protein